MLKFPFGVLLIITTNFLHSILCICNILIDWHTIISYNIQWNLPRPGVTRTVKDMEARGLLTKHTSPEDGRVTYLTITEAGRALSRKYDAEYFSSLVPALEVIPEEDAETMIRTIEIFYQIMVERRDSLEK